MTINKWPPPPEVNAVIAKVGDRFDECPPVWIEVRRTTDWRGRPSCNWKDWWPVTLASHGCGCCGEKDPEPTLWIAIPAEEGADQ